MILLQGLMQKKAKNKRIGFFCPSGFCAGPGDAEVVIGKNEWGCFLLRVGSDFLV
jgi:hypothetical protein